jgi:hypothetical protein
MMRLTLLALGICAAAPLAAQTGLQFTAGATASGTLVSDGVLHTKLKPGVAPTAGIGIALPTGKGPYRVRLEAHYSSSTINVTSSDGTTDRLSSVAVIDAVAMAEGPIARSLRWQLGGGAIFYRPSENQGVFLDGPVQRWLVAGGVIYSQALTPRLNLLVNGRIDAHSFTTDVLVARDYAGSQGVERFVLLLGLERTL